ncbi:peptidylprolyl isomerase [Sporanaerobium hydrogeniformans]|uniref:Peptidylprolyl isomerase n=1 Tax=Sporanaerobium hydrogeniformans TaxID=3072179 RepID=A0AC61DFY1_9FIRM|nr:peptidylprolyl isomerase [Sporanaerobium hydrogeniformans]PHV71681.1 peptidylprolyl isomerase [Sporanaerobium hydrogeniformans]
MENKILAVVDGRNITDADLYELLQSIGQGASQFQSPEGQKQLVNELVMQELLYSDALSQDFDKEPAYLQALERMKKSLLKQYAMNKLLTAVHVSAEEVKAYYEAHKDAFKTPETASASHILVATEDEATHILTEIQNGLAFDEAAKKYSTCPSSAQGGALGEFTRGRMVPEFDKAVFAMTPGEIAGPIQTQFGYHLIQLDQLVKEGEADFEAVKAKASEQCLLAKRQDIYIQKQEELQKIYNVEIK